MPPLHPRFATERLRLALGDAPAVLLNGPRQCGKTTLVQQLASDLRPYLTLDDEAVLAAAQADPVGLLRGLDGAVIDEVQRSPALLRSVKLTMDRDRRPDGGGSLAAAVPSRSDAASAGLPSPGISGPTGSPRERLAG